MITEAITTTIAEYVADLGLDAIKGRINNAIDEKKLRNSLKSYIERQRKYNEIRTMVEEIDFQGLVEYISRNLLNDAGIRIFDPNPKKRGEARQRIIDAAIVYSKANTKNAKNRVVKCISSCLDIIRSYKTNYLSIKDYLLADIIVDPIVEEVQESTDALSAKFDNAKKEILTKMETDGVLFSLDKSVSLAEDGKFNIIENGFQKILDHISLTHPYYPDFGYDFKDGRILSKPLTVEAKKLYPSKYVFTGMMKIGDHYYMDPDGNPLDVAYRRQVPIIMEVSKARKMLGEKPDPRQDEVDGYVGKKMVIRPPEFPPPFPCAVKVKDNTFFEPILFRTQEILDDGTYVVTNQEQGGSIYFELRINPENQRKTNFKFHTDYTNNRDMLKNAQFMSALSRDKELHIYALSAGEDIITGQVDDFNYERGFDSIEK